MNIVKTQQEKNISKTSARYSFSQMPVFEKVIFDSVSISFYLSDHRIITIPIIWIPKLVNASESIRGNYKIKRHFVFWEDVDEIIGVKNLLNGSIVPR